MLGGLFCLENHLQSSPQHFLPPAFNEQPPVNSQKEKTSKTGFTGMKGRINAAGTKRANSPGLLFLFWMLGLCSSLLERKLHNIADCSTLTMHLSLFFQFLQISGMLTLCLGWFPIFSRHLLLFD